MTPLTGGWEPNWMVVIELPSHEQLQTWLTSPEYSAIAPLRETATISKAIVVDGYQA